MKTSSAKLRPSLTSLNVLMALINNPFVNVMDNTLYDIFENQFHVDDIVINVGVCDHLLKMNENNFFFRFTSM